MSLIRCPSPPPTDLSDNGNAPKRVPTGTAAEIVISESSFRNAHRAFQQQQAHLANTGATDLALAAGPPTKKRKREDRGDASVVYDAGSYKGPWARYEEHRPDLSEGESGSDEEVEVEYEEDAIEAQPQAPKSKAGTAYEADSAAEETTQFHGAEEHDYQGRTYMHVPQDLDIDLRREYSLEERKNYVPKKLIHTWKGHAKPVVATRFFPDSGHLLLSASADTKIKIWDVYHQRELLRTYSGHSKAVTDIDFTPSGTSFLSGSYDRFIKVWDTETGICTSRFSTGATPHCLRWNPSMPNEFLAGMSDKKIVQFDVRVGDEKPVQEYDHHLGAVNTITFCDEDRRFVTTSDDKSLKAWEYSIPVPIKNFADEQAFALVRAAAHPSGKHAAFQSADNQIVVFSTDKFKQNKKKSFRGHNTSGYAVDVAISPSGEYISSGDSAGFVCFWDWKSCKMYHKMQTNQGAVTAVAWQPRESSKVVTAGLDGTMKYWD